MANVPFTGYAFSATGGTAIRTLPDRLNDIINVKEFGALGDGAHDDAPNIQAAIDAALTRSGLPLFSKGATVFFPPGKFRVTTPILLGRSPNGTGADVGNVHLVGSGRNATTIFGNLPPGIVLNGRARYGMIFQKDEPAFNYNDIDLISDMTVQNTNQTVGSGAMIIKEVQNVMTMSNCRFIGAAGVTVGDAYGVLFEDCLFECNVTPPTTGMVGLWFMECQAINCKATGFDIGFSIAGPCSVLIGSEAVGCNIGIVVGDYSGQGIAQEQSTGCYIAANIIDSCTKGIWFKNGLDAILIANTIKGNGVQYCIQLKDCNSGFFAANKMDAAVTGAAFDPNNGGAPGLAYSNFVACSEGAGGWVQPVSGATQPAWEFVQCGKSGLATNRLPYGFLLWANRPGIGWRSLDDGTEVYMKDLALQNTFGGTVTGGGTHTYRARYNSSGGAWTRTG